MSKKSGGGTLTAKRYKGTLDDRSLIDIVLEMIDTAKKKEKKDNVHYEYYALLSGQDYIIKPINYIHYELKKNYPYPYIDCTPYDKDNWVFHKFKYSPGLINYYRYVNRKWKKGLIRKGFKAIGIIVEKVLSVLHLTDYQYFKQKKCSYMVEVHGGYFLTKLLITF